MSLWVVRYGLSAALVTLTASLWNRAHHYPAGRCVIRSLCRKPFYGRFSLGKISCKKTGHIQAWKRKRIKYLLLNRRVVTFK
jgi:hypothetical protein